MHPILRRACLGCRFPLEVATVDRCPECGREFDPSDPSSYGVRLDHPVILTVARSTADAELLRLRLADEGIMAACETLRGLSWGTEMREVGCRVHVDAGDLASAKAILERDKAAVAVPDEAAAPWTCGACGEEVDGVFAVCWKCGAPRTDDAEPGQPPPPITPHDGANAAAPTEPRRPERRSLETIGASALAIVAVRTAFGGPSRIDLFIAAIGLACLAPAARRWWRRRGERRTRRMSLRDEDGIAPME